MIKNSNNVIGEYLPVTINIHGNIKSIYKSDEDIKMATIIDYPKCSYGFHHYIHSLRKDIEVLKQFENKKKVYLCVNPFEIDIDNYDKTINKETNIFLNIKGDIPKIISLDFYKLWEIYFMFDISDITKESKNLIMTDDGSIMQSLIHFRQTYSKEYKNDTCHFLKITQETSVTNVKINDLDKDFQNYYEKNKRISVLTDTKLKDKYDLIISGGNILLNENTFVYEQDYFKLLLIQIITGIKNQKKNGNLVVKVFETYTQVMAKIFTLLISSYEKVFIVKPFTSKPDMSERFIVCQNFNISDKEITKLDKLLKTLNLNPKLKIIDIFSSYEIEKDLHMRIIELNTVLSNNYFIATGKIVNFVNSQNYYGDVYQKYRDDQINANKYWTDTFLVESKNYKENKKKIMENSILSNKMIMDKMIKLSKNISD
jgi:23S rRNA U2552 (ribose-2'-O)-methylase RlmE/FtsJ